MTVEKSAGARPAIVFGLSVTRVRAGTSSCCVIGAMPICENVSVAVVATVPGLRMANCVSNSDDVAPSAK